MICLAKRTYTWKQIVEASKTLKVGQVKRFLLDHKPVWAEQSANTALMNQGRHDVTTVCDKNEGEIILTGHMPKGDKLYAYLFQKDEGFTVLVFNNINPDAIGLMTGAQDSLASATSSRGIHDVLEQLLKLYHGEVHELRKNVVLVTLNIAGYEVDSPVPKDMADALAQGIEVEPLSNVRIRFQSVNGN